MKHINTFYTLIFMMFGAVSCSSCGEHTDSKNDADAIDTASVAKDSTEDSQGLPLVIDGQQPSNATESDMTEDVSEPVVQTQKHTTSGGSKETFYISTYGANGKVWGHVTMNGNTGKGTIHDDDENTYTITVTRHGGELYGIDQNGRQYVFRM